MFSQALRDEKMQLASLYGAIEGKGVGRDYLVIQQHISCILNSTTSCMCIIKVFMTQTHVCNTCTDGRGSIYAGLDQE